MMAKGTEKEAISLNQKSAKALRIAKKQERAGERLSRS